MSSGEAVKYLAMAYEEFGHKAVAAALRRHGPNAEKFRVEIRAIELAIQATRAQSSASST